MGYSRCSIGSNSLFFCKGSIVVLALLKYLKNPKSSYVQSYLFIFFTQQDLRIENNVNKTLKKKEKEKVWREELKESRKL